MTYHTIPASETSASGSVAVIRPMQHVLAHRDGIATVLGLLFAQGAMCSKCGYGTRVTSKRWARCKKCGHRNQRRTIAEIEAYARSQARLRFFCEPS